MLASPSALVGHICSAAASTDGSSPIRQALRSLSIIGAAARCFKARAECSCYSCCTYWMFASKRVNGASASPFAAPVVTVARPAPVVTVVWPVARCSLQNGSDDGLFQSVWPAVLPSILQLLATIYRMHAPDVCDAMCRDASDAKLMFAVTADEVHDATGDSISELLPSPLSPAAAMLAVLLQRLRLNSQQVLNMACQKSDQGVFADASLAIMRAFEPSLWSTAALAHVPMRVVQTMLRLVRGSVRHSSVIFAVVACLCGTCVHAVTCRDAAHLQVVAPMLRNCPPHLRRGIVELVQPTIDRGVSCVR